MLENKRILITGGAGAIGSNLVKKLILNNLVVVIDDLSSGVPENLPDHKNLIFKQGSITDENALSWCFERQPDIIIHLAALFANQNSVDHPLLDLEVNAAGTLKLLEFSRNIKLERFVYASSSCVYGNKSGALHENMNSHTETPYAVSKLAGEYYCKTYYQLYDIPAVSLRFFNSYGPGEREGRYRNVIPNFIANAFRGESLTITGDGSETRDFTFVEDIVQGIILAALRNEAKGKILNIGSGRETRIIELANLINELTNNKAPIKYLPRRNWDHTKNRLANIEAARSCLGYEPAIQLSEGLQVTVEWFRDQLNTRR